MSGNASWLFPQDGNEESTRGNPAGSAAADLQPDELVARAFAILADEQVRWRPTRSVNLERESSW